MNFIQTIESDKLVNLFDLPKVLLGQKVEVIIRPLENTAFGCLEKYANPALICEEDGAWERSVKSKYEAAR